MNLAEKRLARISAVDALVAGNDALAASRALASLESHISQTFEQIQDLKKIMKVGHESAKLFHLAFSPVRQLRDVCVLYSDQITRAERDCLNQTFAQLREAFWDQSWNYVSFTNPRPQPDYYTVIKGPKNFVIKSAPHGRTIAVPHAEISHLADRREKIRREFGVDVRNPRSPDVHPVVEIDTPDDAPTLARDLRRSAFTELQLITARLTEPAAKRARKAEPQDAIVQIAESDDDDDDDEEGQKS